MKGLSPFLRSNEARHFKNIFQEMQIFCAFFPCFPFLVFEVQKGGEVTELRNVNSHNKVMIQQTKTGFHLALMLFQT